MTMRRRGRRILIGALVLLLVIVVGGYWYERPLLLTGTGYAAHNACALEYLAHREDPETDLPPNPLVPLLRTTTFDDRSIGSVLTVLARQRAWYETGFGCTLADERPRLPTPVVVDDEANPYADAPNPPEPTTAVREAIDRAFAPGLGTRAVLVLHHGKLVAERYADGFGPETRQLGWSMSKSVTNLIVGRLVKEGQISLADDHLRSGWTDERADITVEELLRMTSGLEWDETYDLGTPITRMLYLEPDMGAYVAAQPAAHAPGSYQQYSSGSTTLLCDILAERTKLGANLPREVLFAPLGLSSAVLEPDATGTPVCSSYLWATPRDWAAIGQFALAEGNWHGRRLLPDGWMTE